VSKENPGRDFGKKVTATPRGETPSGKNIAGTDSNRVCERKQWAKEKVHDLYSLNEPALQGETRGKRKTRGRGEKTPGTYVTRIMECERTKSREAPGKKRSLLTQLQNGKKSVKLVHRGL